MFPVILNVLAAITWDQMLGNCFCTAMITADLCVGSFMNTTEVNERHCSILGLGLGIGLGNLLIYRKLWKH